MAVLLSRDDLHPFFADPTNVDDCADAVLEAYRAADVASGSPLARLLVPMGTAAPATVTVSSSPAHGALVQLRPRPERDPPPDTRLGIYARGGRVVALLGVQDLDLLRVAVPSLIACRTLRPESTRVVTVLGSGIQGRAHARALRIGLSDLTEMRIYSPTTAHREGLARELNASPGPPVRATGSAREALEGADVIVATALSDVPVFDVRDVREGALIVSIARGQLPVELTDLARIFTVTTADSDARREVRARDSSAPLDPRWTRIETAGTLLDVIDGRVAVRTEPDQTVLFMQMGLPGVEAAIIDRVLRWAEKRGVGRQVALS